MPEAPTPEASLITESVITCPSCGTAKLEAMPTDACQFFYECTGCGTLLRPKPGDCCVFCSYGSVPCPPIQTAPREAPSCCNEVSQATAEIRPGVQRPDWSVVTRPAARAALLDRDRARAGGVAAKWVGALPPEQDLAWRAAVALFAKLGRTPTLAEIARELDLPVASLAPLVDALESRDRLRVDRAAGAIDYAYPFTRHVSGHRVELHGRMLHALCAIDALGVGAMVGADIRVAASCKFCAVPVAIETARNGTAFASASPAGTVVWYDLAYRETAAASCCRSIDFFCSDAHLDGWLAAQEAGREGHRLTLDEALEVGRALFGPVLATSPIPT
jgi:hypothetical protein